MNFYLSAIALALALTALGWGVFLSLRVFNIPDITTDGSYTLGAALTAIHLGSGGSWPLAMTFSFMGGFLAGLSTGLIHTKLKINALLAGILVMTAAYSVNLFIMGRSNIPLMQTHDLLSSIQIFENASVNTISLLVLILGGIALLLNYFLKSDFGLAMRATGNAPEMSASMGIPVQRMKVIGLAIANALTALSGSIVAQFQGFADINMGIGIVIFGLGAVMMGETIVSFFPEKSIALRLIAVILGCITFRTVIAFSLASGIDPNWLKAITAAFVLLFVAIPRLRGKSFAND